MSHPTGLSAPQKAEILNSEVNVAPRSKRYTLAFKLRIIEEAARCSAPGELAALLRREGIYFSTLADFRKQKAGGHLEGKRAKNRPGQTDVTAKEETPSAQSLKELAASEREIRRLRRELDCATALLELQKNYVGKVALRG